MLNIKWNDHGKGRKSAAVSVIIQESPFRFLFKGPERLSSSRATGNSHHWRKKRLQRKKPEQRAHRAHDRVAATNNRQKEKSRTDRGQYRSTSAIGRGSGPPWKRKAPGGACKGENEPSVVLYTYDSLHLSLFLSRRTRWERRKGARERTMGTRPREKDMAEIGPRAPRCIISAPSRGIDSADDSPERL